MLCAGAYLTHSYARESSQESFHMFDEDEWHSSLHWIAYSQGSLLSPEEQDTWFSSSLLPGHIHGCPPWSPSFHSIPSHTHHSRVGNPIGFTKWVSHMQLLCDSHHRGVPHRDCAVPVRLYKTTDIPSYTWFINCFFQASPIPCSLDPFPFLCSQSK